MIETRGWMLQNQLNNFPISGTLTLDDSGRLRFALDAGAASCRLGWLEKALDTDDLKGRVQSGERPVAFDLPLAGREITWPRSLGGYGLRVTDGDRHWFVALNYPSGGISQFLYILKRKSTSKPWKDGFAAAGAA